MYPDSYMYPVKERIVYTSDSNFRFEKGVSKMAEKVSEKARLLAASTVLKKHFSRLLDIPPEEICDYLYEDHVITMDGLEKATNKLFTGRDRTRTMMMSLQKAVKRSCSHFERFCDYLISENPALGYSEIAQSMKGD